MYLALARAHSLYHLLGWYKGKKVVQRTIYLDSKINEALNKASFFAREKSLGWSWAEKGKFLSELDL